MSKPTAGIGVDRRWFLGSLLAVEGTLVLGHSSRGQDLLATGTPLTFSPADQSEMVRVAARQLLQSLAPDQRNQLSFSYPKGQSPTAVNFDELGKGPGHWGKPKPGSHDVSFDHDGHPIIRDRSDSGGPGGPGGPGSGPQGPPPGRDPQGGLAGGRPAAAERYGQADAKLAPEGVRGADLSGSQRATLLSLTSEWVGVLNTAHSAARIEEIRQGISDTWFAWSGSTTRKPGRRAEPIFVCTVPPCSSSTLPNPIRAGTRCMFTR